jgi:hypothetical protein
MRYLAAVLGATALLAGTAASAAAAAPRPYPAAKRVSALALAGPRLVWSDGNARVREQDLAGGAARTLYRAPRAAGADLLTVSDLAANAGRVAFVTTGIEEFSEGGDSAIAYSTLRAGPPAGPFPIVVGRERFQPDATVVEEVAAYDGGLVYVARRLHDETRTVTVRPDAGAPRVLTRNPAPLRVEAAGGVAAVAGLVPGMRPRTHIAVFDIATGSPLFEADVAGAVAIAVARDGTLAVLNDGVLSWASPAAPVLHEIASSVQSLGGIAGGTVVFSAAEREGFDVVRAAALARGDVHDVSPALLEPTVEWDGTTLAYHDGSCAIAGDLPAAPPATLPTAPGCPRPPLETAAAVPTRRGTLRVRAMCPGGSADRCAGRARLTGRIGHRHRVLASAAFDLAGGESTRLTLTADPALLRRVGSRAARRRGRHRVALEIRMTAGSVREPVQVVTFQGPRG